MKIEKRKFTLGGVNIEEDVLCFRKQEGSDIKYSLPHPTVTNGKNDIHIYCAAETMFIVREFTNSKLEKFLSKVEVPNKSNIDRILVGDSFITLKLHNNDKSTNTTLYLAVWFDAELETVISQTMEYTYYKYTLERLK